MTTKAGTGDVRELGPASRPNSLQPLPYSAVDSPARHGFPGFQRYGADETLVGAEDVQRPDDLAGTDRCADLVERDPHLQVVDFSGAYDDAKVSVDDGAKCSERTGYAHFRQDVAVGRQCKQMKSVEAVLEQA